MAWFKKPTRVRFVFVAADPATLVVESKPSGDTTVDLFASIARNFGAGVAADIEQWVGAGAAANLMLFANSDDAEEALQGVEGFLRGNSAKIVEALAGDRQIVVAHAVSADGAALVCAGGEFETTPQGFRRFEIREVGEDLQVREV